MEVNKIYPGDCLEVLKTFPDESIDSCVTDPPYDLVSINKGFSSVDSAPAQFGKDGSFSRLSKGFMGKTWDGTGIAFKSETWKEVLRVLKPGAYLLAFGGTRTFHRMACAIEDAGFEIRDCIEWVYGSGFPKSLDISKQIDKMAGVEREVIGKHPHPAGSKGNTFPLNQECNITKPATFLAEKWQGYGTALKPSHEPIVLARKPLSEKNVALNVLKWGTGGINIDGCRVGTDLIPCSNDIRSLQKWKELDGRKHKELINPEPTFNQGRFPANLIHDGSPEVIKEFPMVEDEEDEHTPTKQKTLFGNIIEKNLINASRFFYCAKASKDERNEGCEGCEGATLGIEMLCSKCGITQRHAYEKENMGSCVHVWEAPIKKNSHPTVKPIVLMQYLIKLITPPKGIVLDPFAGSGSTGVACIKLGYNFVGIEKEEEYIKIAEARIKCHTEQTKL